MGGLEFGFARRCINPTVPVSLAGYFGARMWTEVLDDLAAHALVLRQGGTTAALVQCDLIGAPAPLVARCRDALSGTPALAGCCLLLTATHTHTGPVLRPDRPGANPAYVDALVGHVAEAVQEAAASLRPGRARVGMARDDRFAFNRRHWMRDGRVVTNPRRCDPGIDRAEGPIDADIPLLALEHDDGARVLLANVVNHADTIGGTGVSAGWPGFLRRALEARNAGLSVVPLIGASGNINHFDVSREIDQTHYDEARRIGEGYAESVQSALADLAPCERDELRACTVPFTTGPREIDEAEMAQARVHAALRVDADHPLTSEDLARNSPAALKYFAEALLAVAADRAERTFDVVGMAVGDALLIGLPGEPFVETGLAIRHGLFGGRPTLVASHANAECGYIPNASNFGRGGYETHPMSSPNSVRTAEHMLEAAREVCGILTGA